MRLPREVREAMRHPKPNKIVWIRTGPELVGGLPRQVKLDLVKRYGKILG